MSERRLRKQFSIWEFFFLLYNDIVRQEFDYAVTVVSCDLRFAYLYFVYGIRMEDKT